MSGAEIAGLVIGAPPLFFYVLDNYSRALRPLKRLQKYDKYISDLNLLVNTGRLAFRNAIRVLLTAVFSGAEAQLMVDDLEYYRWTDPASETSLRDYLQDNYEAALDKAQEISDMINPLLEQIPIPDEAGEQSETTSRRKKAKRLIKRLQLCFKEEQFQKAMDRVASCIDALESLIDHPRKCEQAEEIFKNRQRLETTIDGTMKTFEIIKQSSKSLFETVQRCCNIHELHYAYFGLNPAVQDIKVAHISFDLQYGQHTTANQSSTFVLEIESSLKLATLVAPCSGNKRLRLEDSGPSQKDFELQETTELPEFMLRGSFCAWLKRHLATNPITVKDCIGCVNRNPKCQLRFHVKNNPIPDVAVPTSLQGLFGKIQNGQGTYRLPLDKKLRYARILASGVMSFYDTPWLPASRLHSKNIVLCGLDPSLDLYDPALPDPSINVAISAVPHPRAQDVMSHSFIKNLLVFQLGIMLVELALDESIETLQLPSERDRGGVEGNKATAERLLGSVGLRINKRYQTVARKCLRSYAAEEPLSSCDKKHRKNFHDDIVAELQELETGFNKLSMGGDDESDEPD